MLFFYCQMFFYFVEEAVEKKPHLIAFAIYPPLKRGGKSLFFVGKVVEKKPHLIYFINLSSP